MDVLSCSCYYSSDVEAGPNHDVRRRRNDDNETVHDAVNEASSVASLDQGIHSRS